MTWGGQVRAVFVKDLRQTWWVLVALVALMLAVVLRMPVWQQVDFAALSLYFGFIPMLMAFALAFAVRADPPGVSTAFWGTQPLEPSAVAAAKLLHSVVLALIVSVGAAAVLQWGRVAPGAWSPVGAVIAIGMITLCVAIMMMTVLASTRWMAPLGVVLALTAWMLLLLYRSERLQSPGTLASSLTSVVASLFGAVTLLAMYRARAASTPLFEGFIALVTQPFTRVFRNVGTATAAHTPSRSTTSAMTWAVQVRHVFMRSLGDTQLSLAVAVVLLTVAVTRTVLGIASDFWLDLLCDYGVRLAILFHLASVVLSDPPPHPTSFWATQPREPSAVATAKLLHGLLMLLMLVTATLIVQSAWHFSGMQRLLTLDAWLTPLVAIALPALVWSAFSIPSRKAVFTSAFLLFNYGNLFNGSQDFLSHTAVGSAFIRLADVLTVWAWLPLSAALAGLLVWRYRQADLQGHFSELFAVVLCLTPFALLMRGTGVLPLRVADASTVPPLSMTVFPGSDYVWFELHAPRGLPGDAYRLVNWALILTRKDGSTTRLDGSDLVLSRRDGRTATVRLAGDSLPVIGEASVRMSDSAGFRDLVSSDGQLTPENISGIVAARLEGTIESYNLSEVDRLPLRNGLAFLENGRRAAVTIMAPDAAGPRISLRTKWLGNSIIRHAAWPVNNRMDHRHLGFALINTTRGSMLPLRLAEDGWIGTSRQQLGFGVSGFNYTLRPAIWTLPIPPVDSAWLAGAELVVGTPVFTSAVRISVNGIVEQPAPGRTRRSG